MFDIVQAVVVVCTYDDALHEVVDTGYNCMQSFRAGWIIPDMHTPTTLAIRYNYGYRLNEKKKTPQKQQQQ